jgi:hypothetical protein
VRAESKGRHRARRSDHGSRIAESFDQKGACSSVGSRPRPSTSSGDLVSGFAYKSSRPYSFKDQWISELTATGSPVRPGMLTVITIHDLLLIAFGIGVWRAGADAQNRSLRWPGVVLIAAHSPPTSLASPRGDGACIPRIPASIVRKRFTNALA